MSKKNPFLDDQNHFGPMTVRQLVELVKTSEFPLGLDTKIRIGDVEANNPCAENIQVTAHKRGDIVLSIDPNDGDPDYYDNTTVTLFDDDEAEEAE